MDDFTSEQLDYVAMQAWDVIMENLVLQDSVEVEQRHIDAVMERLEVYRQACIDDERRF